MILGRLLRDSSSTSALVQAASTIVKMSAAWCSACCLPAGTLAFAGVLVDTQWHYPSSRPGRLSWVFTGRGVPACPVAMAFSWMRLVTRMSRASLSLVIVRSTVPGCVGRRCFTVLTVHLKIVPSVPRTIILYFTFHPACLRELIR